MTVVISRVDYRNVKDRAQLVALLDLYARDPMGGGAPLGTHTRENLCDALAARPTALSLLAKIGTEAVGLANCFEGFSTFACQPLLNIHDLAVRPDYRGQGVGRALLDAIATEARARGCCKVTLEVLSGNAAAQALYARAGYKPYALDPAMGQAVFLEYKL